MTYQSRVLIVDDAPLGRKVLQELLCDEGHELTFATTGPEALARAAEETPDLVLLDVMMPGMDGFEVCRRLRATGSTADVPILLLTALDDRNSLLEGIEAGADDFITKPFDHAELRARVRTITRLNRHRRLLQERIKFQVVVDRAESGYVVVDDEDRILFANSKARLFLGLADQESATEARLLALASEQYHREPRDAWDGWPSSADAGVARYFVRPETPTARAFWLKVEVLEHLPAEPGWVVALHDVTASQASQREMRTFHVLVQHKLRTPLTRLLTSLDLLVNQSERARREEVSSLAHHALRGAQSLHRDIEEVIRFVEAPGLGAHGCPGDLGALTELVQRLAGSLALRVHTDLDRLTDAGTRIVLPTRALELVLLELLENSRRHHPARDPSITVRGSLSDDHLLLEVSDDGLTLSPEQLSRVWSPYYQGEKYFTGSPSGLGLGLTMVATTIWGVGGQCEMFNRTDGPGILVRLEIPILGADETGR